MFKLFGESLFHAGSYNVEELVPQSEYLATHVKVDKREKWYKRRYKVVVSEWKEKFICECRLY